MFRHWLKCQQPTWLIVLLFLLGVFLEIHGSARKPIVSISCWSFLH
jgi:hypothetical protein